MKRRTLVGAGFAASAGAAALALGGCVTINIYFPAAAAEKVADKIIEEVYQIKNATEPAKTPEKK
jgi:hypothetical protein